MCWRGTSKDGGWARDEDHPSKAHHCSDGQWGTFKLRENVCLPPAKIYSLLSFSFKKIAPATAVHMGARKVSTVVSDKDRYWRG